MRPSPKNQKLIRSPFQKPEDFSVLELARYIGEIQELIFKMNKLKENYGELFNNHSSELSKLTSSTQKNLSNEIGKLNSRFELELEKIIKKANYVISKIQKGDKGDSYILTEKDKKEIGSNIEVPVVEKIIEKTHTIKEQPVYTTKVVENKFTKEMFLDFIKDLPDGILEIKDIKDLEERLSYLASKIGLHGGGPSGGGQGSWKQKQLSGTINGSNTVFTFVGDPPAEYSERVFLNYIEQNPFTDYTISGNTITYTTAPDASLSGLPHIIRFM